jgi:uncharacterized protein (AIM24 family)
MQVKLMYEHAYTVGQVSLSGGEQVRVEAASMVGMSGGVTLETQATGGFMKSLKRSLLGGESFFQNVYTAPATRAAMCWSRPRCLATSRC